MLTDSLIRRIVALESWQPPEGVTYEIRIRPATDEIDIELRACECVSSLMSVPVVATAEFLELLTREAEAMFRIYRGGCSCCREPFVVDTTAMGRDEPEPVVSVECCLCDAAFSGTRSGAAALGWANVVTDTESSLGIFTAFCPACDESYRLETNGL